MKSFKILLDFDVIFVVFDFTPPYGVKYYVIACICNNLILIKHKL
jgi:hypothetical protein